MEPVFTLQWPEYLLSQELSKLFPDEPLVVEVVNGVVGNIEVMFWDDPERTDGGQYTAVFAVKLVDSVAVNDQFALVTARQVEVAHQAITRIVFIPIARVVHARPVVAAITLVELARITPSSIGHRPLLAWVLQFWVVREDALAVAARSVLEAPKRRGVSPRSSVRVALNP